MSKEKTQAKTMVFTVADSENPTKPTVYCQMATDEVLSDQEMAERMIMDYVDNHLEEIVESDVELEEMAYAMRKNGAAWFKERYCFELTEVNG